MKPSHLISCILLSASILLTGCIFLMHPINSTFARHSNPIAGWKSCAVQNPDQFPPAIHDDYLAYRRKLESNIENIIISVAFYEDSTGQRAVSIELDYNGTTWTHVLIYDRNNKRIKTIKYVSGYYMC